MKEVEALDEQYHFWGVEKEEGTVNDLWDALHAHFEKQASEDGRAVEETSIRGRGSVKKEQVPNG